MNPFVKQFLEYGSPCTVAVIDCWIERDVLFCAVSIVFNCFLTFTLSYVLACCWGVGGATVFDIGVDGVSYAVVDADESGVLIRTDDEEI